MSKQVITPDQKQKIFLLGVGAQKSGTTWLHDYLKGHPNTSLGFAKEYHVFDSIHIPECEGFLKSVVASALKLLEKNNLEAAAREHVFKRLDFISNPNSYFDYFESLVNQSADAWLTGDITPVYAALPVEVFAQIKRDLEARGFKPKVVFLMRDPVERCISATRMQLKKKNGKATITQESENRMLRNVFKKRDCEIRTSYDKTIKNLESVFQPSEIFYEFYEAFFTKQVMERLCDFLEIPFHEPDFEKEVWVSRTDNRLDVELLREVRSHYGHVYDFVAERFGKERVSHAWPNYTNLHAVKSHAVQEAVVAPDSAAQTPQGAEIPAAKLCLATCVRNEGPYLLDWVLYHRALGFDEIVIYSNDNNDDSNPLLAAMQKEGLVTWIDRTMREGESPQLSAYRKQTKKMFKSATDSNSYLAWLDVDEYLILKQDETVQDLLLRYQHPDALFINWMHFGSAGKTHWENVATPLRFTSRASTTPLDRHYKSVSKVDPAIFNVIKNHRPVLKAGASARMVYASSGVQDVPVSKDLLDGSSPVGDSAAPVFHDVCYIAHYSVRSREEFLWKKNRGNGRLPVNSEKAQFLDGYFDSHDLNDIHDSFAAEKFEQVVGRLSKPDYASLTSLFEPLVAKTVAAATR